MYAQYILSMGGFPRINWPKVPPPKPIRVAPLPPVRIPPPPPINIPPPKPVDMRALQQAVGIIGGAVSATPVGKLVMMGITGIADASTGGKASNYLNDGRSVNSTLSMLPGGVLAQRVANLATDGKSGAAISKTVVDPMHLAIHDIKVIAATVATNPGNTLTATKALAADNRAALVTVLNNDARLLAPSIAKNNVLSRTIAEPAKPSLFAVAAGAGGATAALNTLSSVAPPPYKAPLIAGMTLTTSRAATTFSTLSAVPSPMQADLSPVVAKVSTLAFDPAATVAKLAGGSTLPSVPPPPSSLLTPTVAIVVPDNAPRNTLSAASKIVTARISEPVFAPGASTLSRPPAATPSVDFGSYLPAAGVLGVLAMLLL